MLFRSILLALCCFVLTAAPLRVEAASGSCASSSIHQPAPGLSLLAQRWKARAVDFLGKVENHASRYLPTPPAVAADRSDRTNAFAIVALCCGIGGLTFVPFLGSIAAVVFGVIALSQIKKTGDKGKGMAIAGIALGAVGVLLLGLYIAVLLSL